MPMLHLLVQPLQLNTYIQCSLSHETMYTSSANYTAVA